MASELLVARGEMEHGAADDAVGQGIRERHRFDRFVAKIFGRKRRGQRCGEAAGCVESVWIGIGGKDFKAVPEQVYEIAAGTAPGIEDTHPGGDAPAEELIEQVDVDVAELSLQISQIGQIGHEARLPALGELHKGSDADSRRAFRHERLGVVQPGRARDIQMDPGRIADEIRR